MEEARVRIVRPDFELEGRLAMPTSTHVRNVPCVVLLCPWGAWDMEGSHEAEVSLDGNPVYMFRQLRDAMLSRGVAVLRYNTRFVSGEGGAKPQFEDRTLSGMVGDARAAVELARNTPGIDPKRIWLLGISLGTEVAVSVGEQDHDLQGLILMATIGENYRNRGHYMDVERKLQWLIEQGLVNEQGDVDLERVRELSVLRWGWWGLEPEFQDATQMPYEQVAAVLKHHHYRRLESLLQEGDADAPSAFWQEWIGIEATYQRVGRFPGRVLIAQGLDDNTTPPREAYLMQAALSGRSNVDLKLFEDLGHIFSKRRSNSRRTFGPLDPDVLNFVADYLATHA